MPDLETDLPTDALESLFADELGEAVRDTEPLGGALNVMVAVTTDSDRYVLRCPTDLRDTELFVDARTEYRVLERLTETAVPAPEPVLYCEDDSVLDSEFFLTTHLDGDPVPVGSRLPERFRNPEARREFGDVLVDALADLHSVDPDGFREVCKHHTPLDMLDRDVERLERATEATGRDADDLWRAADWLRENAPESFETRLVHGDYKPGNVLFAPGDDPEVAGVFDWETPYLGDPRTELAYLLFYWRDDGDPAPDVDALADRYDDADALADLRETNEHGFLPFSNRPGSPSRRDLVARWEAQTGLAFEDSRFFRVHAAFGLATVWEDIHRSRVEAGDTEPDSDPLLDYTGALIAKIIDGDFAL